MPRYEYVSVEVAKDIWRPASVHAVRWNPRADPKARGPYRAGWVYILLPPGAGADIGQVFRGRVCVASFGGPEALTTPVTLAVDATASRFHPASIAGLVVGAMGAFVFAVALGHWLGERRRLREEARA
jgi:hypothetical protein